MGGGILFAELRSCISCTNRKPWPGLSLRPGGQTGTHWTARPIRQHRGSSSSTSAGRQDAAKLWLKTALAWPPFPEHCGSAFKIKACVTVSPSQPAVSIHSRYKNLFSKQAAWLLYCYFIWVLIQRLAPLLPSAKATCKGQYTRQLSLCELRVDRRGHFLCFLEADELPLNS